MMTGNIGREGVGVNPLRGQNNVQGACDMGSFPHDSPATATSATAPPAKSTKACGGTTLDSEPGLRIPNMLDEAVAGRFMGLLYPGRGHRAVRPRYAPRHRRPRRHGMRHRAGSLPERNRRLRPRLSSPARPSWRKDGTFTNAERRITASAASCPRAPVWRIGKLPWRSPKPWATDWTYAHPSEIMDEVAATTPSFAGVRLRPSRPRRLGPMAVQYRNTGRHARHAHRAFRARGRALHDHRVCRHRRAHRAPRFPLLLTTGRILSHYNVGAQTRRTANVAWHKEDVLKSTPATPKCAASVTVPGCAWPAAPARPACAPTSPRRVAPGVVYTTFHHPVTQANVVTTDHSDWATNCPEFK